MGDTKLNNNIEKKKICHDFVEKVKKYLVIDDQLSELKNKTKLLNIDKNTLESSILEYLTEMDETVIDTNDGKLKKSICKQKGGIKKDYIINTLSETFDDAIKVQLLTDKIMDSIPCKEKVSLKRTKK